MIIYQSQIDSAKLLTSPLDGGEYKLILSNTGERVVISMEYCTNRNHAHERAGPCRASSYASRHDCFYCGSKGYGMGNKLTDTFDPCGHYHRKGN